MKRYFADKTSLRLLRGFSLGLTALLILLLYRMELPYPTLKILLLLIFLGLGCFFAFWYLPVYFKNIAYYVSASEIVKHSGFFLRRKQVMRTEAIQYSTAVSTPLSSLTGLNFLIFSALGGRLVLLFLTKKDVDDILRTLHA